MAILTEQVSRSWDTYVYHFLLFQGAYFGIFTGAAMTTWVFLGSVLYPPNKYPALRSVRGCDFFNETIPYGTIKNASTGGYDGKIIWDADGYIRNPFKEHRYLQEIHCNLYTSLYFQFHLIEAHNPQFSQLC